MFSKCISKNNRNISYLKKTKATYNEIHRKYATKSETCLICNYLVRGSHSLSVALALTLSAIFRRDNFSVNLLVGI